MATKQIRALTTEFGKRARERRLELGMSQEALGAEAGLDRTYIGGIERGERNLSLVNIVRLCQALEIDPSRLVKGLRL